MLTAHEKKMLFQKIYSIQATFQKWRVSRSHRRVKLLIPNCRSKRNKYLNELVGVGSADFSLSPLEAFRVCSSPTTNLSPSEGKLQVKHFRLTTALGTRRTSGCSYAAGVAPSAGHRRQGLGPGSESFFCERSGGSQTRNEDFPSHVDL